MDSDHMRIILQQHYIFLDVLRTYQASRWPWVRWVANQMYEEIMWRCALIDYTMNKES